MAKTKRLAGLSVAMGVAMTAAASAADLKLIAAGSLEAALGEVAEAYSRQSGAEVAATFGPSGLMRKRVEAGEAFHVFASANMTHPEALAEAGRAGAVTLFARNRLCALARDGLEVDSTTLLATLLKDEVRLGTSTPKADPSGDYAFALFAKAEAVETGAAAKLKAKALQLTGGPDSEKAPDGRNTYAWVMEDGRADVFLTYCTNAVLARRELPALQIIDVPAELAVGADYGLTVLAGAPAEAASLAAFILSAEGQRILAGYGFTPVNPTD